MRKLDSAKIATIGAMCTALTVLSLYAAAVLPTARLAFYFLSSMFVYMLAEEELYLGALVSFLASCALGFLILPNALALVPYAALLGHYGIFRTWFSRRMGDPFVRVFVCLLYCNVFTALSILAAVFFFHYDLTALALPAPVWMLILALEIGFVLFDVLYWMCAKIYVERIKSVLIPRR